MFDPFQAGARRSLAVFAPALLAGVAGAQSYFGPGGAIPTAGSGGGTYPNSNTTELSSAVTLGYPVTAGVIQVNIDDWKHTWVGDLQVVLVDPNGVGHNLMVRPGFDSAGGFGNDGDLTGGPYVFVDPSHPTAAAAPDTAATDMPAGKYKQHFGDPGGSPPGGTWVPGTVIASSTGNITVDNAPLSSITGPAGTWTLKIFDWASGDAGSIAGWAMRVHGTPNPVTYCNSKPTSNSCLPSITSSGIPDAFAPSGFVVTGGGFINNKSCVLLYGFAGPATTVFQGGLLCVRPPLRRTVGVSSGGNLPPNDCSGAPSLDMNAFAQGLLGGSPDPGLQVPGNVVHCQWWGRDPGYPPPNNTQLSNGLAYTIGPVTPSGSMFQDMVFNGVAVVLAPSSSFQHGAVLNGNVAVSSAGEPNGWVSVSFDDGSSATISFNPTGATQIQTGASTLNMLTSGNYSDDQALLNGSPVSLTAITDQLRDDLDNGVAPNLMSDSSRAMLALSTLGYTSQWNMNVGLALQLGSALAVSGFWCKLAVWVATTAIITLGILGLLYLCGVASVATLGGLSVPCALVIVGVAIVGTALLEFFLLLHWTA